MDDGPLEIEPYVALPRITLKQKRFIKEYLKDLNASAACIRAGYNVAPTNASKLGSQLLANARLLPHLNRALELIDYSFELDHEDVAEKLSLLADSNILDYVESLNGRALVLKDLSKLPRELGYCIKSIKETMNGIEIILYDKLKAIEILARVRNMMDAENKPASINVFVNGDK